MLLRTLLASAIYLLPVVLVLGLRSREGEDRSLWELAGDLPAAVAADLLLVLLLSRVMILEWAAIVSRALWIAGAAAVIARRARGARRPVWPGALARGAAVQAGLLALLALGTSLVLSRACAIWDREWHIPLVASLRGQRLPFMNVYEPGGGLYYHFTGDVFAAMLQAFSGEALHASLALSLAHDLVFGLLGAELGLVLWAVGLRRAPLAVLVLAATLLAGPVTLLREPARKLESGYSIVNLLSLSFRPHVSLAYLFMLGVVGFALAGILRGRAPVVMRRLWPSLGLSVAALALTDESSLALLLLGLGAVWLRDPELVGTDRRRSVWVGLGLAGLLALTIGLFVGAVGLGAPRYPMHVVAPRAPGFLTPPVPLTTRPGLGLVAQDLWSALLVAAAGLALAIRGGRSVRLAGLFYGVVLAVGVAAFCALEVNQAPIESHRWVTAPLLLAPLIAAVWLVEPVVRRAAPAGAADPPPTPAVAAGWPALLVYLGCGLAAASTVEWLASGVAVRECRRHQNFAGFGSEERFYDVDCRVSAGARLGEPARVSYAESTGAYLYTGCRPTFVPGPVTSLQKIKVGRPTFGLPAIDEVDREMLAGGAPLAVACLAGHPPVDPACVAARATGVCGPCGSAFDACTLSAAERGRLLGRALPTPARAGRMPPP
jgi:hypothetical protein